MFQKRRSLVVFLLSCTAGVVHADQAPLQAVFVKMVLAEQQLDRVREKVGDPVMDLLKTLPGVGSLSSLMTHAYAHFEIQFQGGANEDDRGSVATALKRLALEREVEVLSIQVELAPQRHDSRTGSLPSDRARVSEQGY